MYIKENYRGFSSFISGLFSRWDIRNFFSEILKGKTDIYVLQLIKNKLIAD